MNARLYYVVVAPPSVRADLEKLQELDTQLQQLLLKKQQYEAELKDIDRAISEIEKLTPPDAKLYKAVGTFLISVNKDQALQDLKDRKELLDLHVKTLAKQEQMLRKQMSDIETRVNSLMQGGSVGGAGAAPGGG